MSRLLSFLDDLESKWAIGVQKKYQVDNYTNNSNGIILFYCKLAQFNIIKKIMFCENNLFTFSQIVYC